MSLKSFSAHTSDMPAHLYCPSKIRKPMQADFVSLGKVRMMKDYVRTVDGRLLDCINHYQATELAAVYDCRLPTGNELWEAFEKNEHISRSIRETIGPATGECFYEWTADVVVDDKRLARPKVRKVGGKFMYDETRPIPRKSINPKYLKELGLDRTSPHREMNKLRFRPVIRGLCRSYNALTALDYNFPEGREDVGLRLVKEATRIRKHE